MCRAIAAVLLAAALVVVPAAVARPQQSEPATEPATEVVDDEATSNLVPLLVGAILLGGGIWAYMNKKQRFPGTRFRE